MTSIDLNKIKTTVVLILSAATAVSVHAATKKLPLVDVAVKKVVISSLPATPPLNPSYYNVQDFVSYLQTRADLPTASISYGMDYRNVVSAYYDKLPFVLPPGAHGQKLLGSPDYEQTSPTLDDTEVLQKIRKLIALPAETTDIVISRGIRKLVSAVFAGVGKDSTVILPEDQYPVYQQLAQKQGVNFKTYTSVPRINFHDFMRNAGDTDLLVITNPLAPHGRALRADEVESLADWLKDKPQRRILLDTSYNFATQFDQATLRLLNTGQVYVAYSLAKSWLLPGHLGILFGGNASDLSKIRVMAEPPDPLLVAKALQVMAEEPRLPTLLSDVFAKRWQKLEQELSLAEIPGYERPSSGYFGVVPQDAYSLLHKKGIRGYPLSVFGSSNPDYTVLSVLPDKVEEVYYATVLSNFARAYDKYAGVYTKAGVSQSTFPDKFFLLTKQELAVGIAKATQLLKKTGLDGDRILIVKTSVPSSELQPNENTGIARYIRDNKITIDDLLVQEEDGSLVSVRLEDVFADSLRLNADKFVPFDEITPRSISILPVAKACQACCKFCFSEASISTQRREKDQLTPDMLKRSFTLAKQRGAERAVISGGGEPTLVGIDRLSELVETAASYFPNKVTLITNGMTLVRLPEEQMLEDLLRLDRAGLKTLAISHHHHHSEKNTSIMGVDIDVEKIASVYAQHKDMFATMKLRLICVLQKSGVSTATDIEDYIAWAAGLGISEINFKELYVSTDRESTWASSPSNIYSEQNRVHLSVAVDYFEKNNWQMVYKLPWGSPIYQKKYGDMVMQVAAYTEPSVWWERTNGIARSWNLMSDGKLMVSLEDGESELSY